MGEPEPINLLLLQQGDHNEVKRAIRELGLMEDALKIIHGIMGRAYPADVRDVAQECLKKLFTDAIHTCQTVGQVRVWLRNLARWRALNFVNDAFNTWERKKVDPLFDEPERPARGGIDPEQFLGEVLANGLGLENLDLERIVPALVELAGLSPIEEHLLVEHVLGTTTQSAFANNYGVSLKGLGGRKDRMLEKIRAALTARSPEIREILRRNRELELIHRRRR